MYIITGGAGFIGSVIWSRLNQLGHKDIWVVDSLRSNDKYRNMVGKHSWDYSHKSDFLSQIQTKQINQRVNPSDIKGIIHMGACSSTFQLDSDYLMQNNFEYSKVLCNFALEHGIRFIYASSAATYGSGNEGYNDDHSQLSSLRPLNPYGFSKHIFDLWLAEHKLLDQVVGLKFFNVYGPNEYHKDEQRSVICKAYLEAQISKSVALFKSYHPDYKDGESKRDFIYVKDCAEAIVALLRQPDANGIFNLGTGKARSWLDLARALLKSMDLPENIIFKDMPEVLRGRYQYFTEANMSKFNQLKLPVQFHSLEDGVEDFVRNYLQSESKIF
jgi:ADP-L-glycero-D-manno-heptose 6-epimerase